MNINVKPEHRDHFWDEPPDGFVEFWSFGRWKPPCKAGDPLIFRFDGAMVARAVCHVVEPPGQSKCAHSGRHANGWKVYWLPETFIDMRSPRYEDAEQQTAEVAA